MYRPDNEIIDQIQKGKKHLYALLVDRYKDQSMTLAVRILKNREEAEEAIQDAFVRAYRSLEKFEQRSRFSTWLYRIVYNVCLSKLSSRKNEVLLFQSGDGEEMENFPEQDYSPDVEYEQAEKIECIKQTIESLPEKYRAIISLFYFQELSYEEICGVTNLPLGTVKTHLFRARAMLLKQLSSHYQIEAA